MARPERRRRPSGARSEAAKRRPSARSHRRSGNIITSAASRPSSGVPQPSLSRAATKASRPCAASGVTRAISTGSCLATFRHSAGDSGESTFWPSSSVRCAVRCFSISLASWPARTALDLACATEDASASRWRVRLRRCAASSGSSVVPSGAVPSWANCSVNWSSCGCRLLSSASASRRTCDAVSDSIASVSVASAESRLRSTSFRLASNWASCCFGVGSSSWASTGAASSSAPHSSSASDGPRIRIVRRKESKPATPVRADHRACARLYGTAGHARVESSLLDWRDAIRYAKCSRPAVDSTQALSTSSAALPPAAAAARTNPGIPLR